MTIQAGTEVRDADGDLVLTFVNEIPDGAIIHGYDVVMPDGSAPLTGAPYPRALVAFLQALPNV